MCPVEGSSRDECACCHGDPGSRWERGALHFTWWNDSRCREDDERLFRRPPSSSRQSSSSCFRLSTRRAATAAVSHQQPNESGQRWTDGHQRNVWQSQKTSRHLILLLYIYIYRRHPPKQNFRRDGCPNSCRPTLHLAGQAGLVYEHIQLYYNVLRDVYIFKEKRRREKSFGAVHSLMTGIKERNDETGGRERESVIQWNGRRKSA